MTVSPSLIPAILLDGPFYIYLINLMMFLAFYVVLPIVSVLYVFRALGYYFSRFGGRWGLVALTCFPASLIVAGPVALIRRDDYWLLFLSVLAAGYCTFIVSNVVLTRVLHQPGWFFWF